MAGGADPGAGTWSLTRAYDAMGRPSGLSLRDPSSVLSQQAFYAYDSAGRLSAVSNEAMSATYTYAADALTIAGTTLRDGAGRSLKANRAYDGFNRLNVSSNLNSGLAVLSSFAYTHDAADRRTRVDQSEQSDRSYWMYAYDGLGQLTAGKKFFAGGVLAGGAQFEYGYDQMGNRTSARNYAGPATPSVEYAANALNQYANATAPRRMMVTGVADPTARVTVQAGESVARLANRHGDYFWADMAADNSGGPVVVTNVIRVVKPDGTNSLLRAETRVESLPRNPRMFTYDADGNLTSDGLCAYTWDAENRLTSVTPTLPSALTPRLVFTYDSLGRRVRKQVFARDSDSWILSSDSSFVYDRWNPISEIVRTPAPPTAHTNFFTWGLDLSGSLHGAAGVGGLIGILSSDSCLLTPVYDGSGNVVGLVSGTNVVATYEYGPFGELLRAIGPAAAANPWRFSTRYADDELHAAGGDLVMYPARPYSPTLGRFLSRDPVAEQGGMNVYAFVGNAPPNGVDPLGLALYAFDGTGTRFETWTHIAVLYRSYQGTKHYIEGVGSRWYSLILGGATGLGGKARLDDMYELLVETYKKGDHDIDIIGFSRGASLAREFANMIYARGIVETTYRWESDRVTGQRQRTVDGRTILDCAPKIRFVGLFDTVGSFGIPGNDINPGIRMGLPPNVEHAAQAVAQDERRSQFPLTPLNRAGYEQTFSERVFEGDHSDIGGGYEQDQNLLALAPLFYIWSKGRSAGVPFGPVNLVWDQHQYYLEVGGERRPWAYQLGQTPHDLSTSLPYTDGGHRSNLPEGTP